MKEKLIKSVYHYDNYRIVIEQNWDKLCGYAVEFKYAHLFNDITELYTYDDDNLISWGLDTETEISAFYIDELDETELYCGNVDIDDPQSILNYLINQIDSFAD
jgi:hypothetical protein